MFQRMMDKLLRHIRITLTPGKTTTIFMKSDKIGYSKYQFGISTLGHGNGVMKLDVL